MTQNLGKLDYISDPRTLKLADFFATDLSVATYFDTDQYRRSFPQKSWSSDVYGNSVLAVRANAQLRLERIEQKRTIPLSEATVVALYKSLTGCKKPGDKNDTGLAYLPMMQQWKNTGWQIGKRNYKISVYGELDPLDREQLMFGCYILTGIHFGFALPLAVKREKNWLYEGEKTPEWKAGSWGGYAAFGYAYNSRGFFIKAWDNDFFVSWEFIEHFCDEAWAVIPSLDILRVKRAIDTEKLSAAIQPKEGDNQINN